MSKKSAPPMPSIVRARPTTGREKDTNEALTNRNTKNNKIKLAPRTSHDTADDFFGSINTKEEILLMDTSKYTLPGAWQIHNLPSAKAEYKQPADQNDAEEYHDQYGVIFETYIAVTRRRLLHPPQRSEQKTKSRERLDQFKEQSKSNVRQCAAKTPCRKCTNSLWKQLGIFVLEEQIRHTEKPLYGKVEYLFGIIPHTKSIPSVKAIKLNALKSIRPRMRADFHEVEEIVRILLV